MIKLYKYNGSVINFDNAYFAAKFASDNPDAEEIPDNEVSEVFGDYASFASPDNTTISDDGTIVFDDTEARQIMSKNTLEKNKKIVEDEFNVTCESGVEYNGAYYRCKQEDMRLMEDALSVAKRTNQEEVKVRSLGYTWNTLTVSEFEDLCNLVAVTYFTAYESYSLSLNDLYD